MSGSRTVNRTPIVGEEIAAARRRRGEDDPAHPPLSAITCESSGTVTSSRRSR